MSPTCCNGAVGGFGDSRVGVRGLAPGDPSGGVAAGYRDLKTVTCFKCWQTGHYANNCPNPRVPPPEGQAPQQQFGGGGWQ